jgi:hypothetical protein
MKALHLFVVLSATLSRGLQTNTITTLCPTPTTTTTVTCPTDAPQFSGFPTGPVLLCGAGSDCECCAYCGPVECGDSPNSFCCAGVSDCAPVTSTITLGPPAPTTFPCIIKEILNDVGELLDTVVELVGDIL